MTANDENLIGDARSKLNTYSQDQQCQVRLIFEWKLYSDNYHPIDKDTVKKLK